MYTAEQILISDIYRKLHHILSSMMEFLVIFDLCDFSDKNIAVCSNLFFY